MIEESLFDDYNVCKEILFKRSEYDMKHLSIGLIKFYQKIISPLKPPTCRFYPTCSEYSLQAFQRFGFWKGFFLTVKRISKCHPFHEGGVDLVPEKKNK